MPTELPRVTLTLAPAEWDALELHAAARGQRPSEAARGAVVAMLRASAQAEGGAAGLHPSDPASLAAAAADLARTADTLAQLLPSAEASARSEEYVRQSLDEIAQAVGTVAGAVVPLEEPDPDNWGIRTRR